MGRHGVGGGEAAGREAEVGEEEACEVCFERAFDTRLLPCR